MRLISHQTKVDKLKQLRAEKKTTKLFYGGNLWGGELVSKEPTTKAFGFTLGPLMLPQTETASSSAGCVAPQRWPFLPLKHTTQHFQFPALPQL